MDHYHYLGCAQLPRSQNFQICLWNIIIQQTPNNITVLKVSAILKFEDTFKSLALQLPTVNQGDHICFNIFLSSTRNLPFSVKETIALVYRFKGGSAQLEAMEPIGSTVPKGNTYHQLMSTQSQTNTCQVCDHNPPGTVLKKTNPKPT